MWVHTMSALSAGLELGVVLDGKQHVIQSGNRRSRRNVGGCSFLSSPTGMSTPCSAIADSVRADVPQPCADRFFSEYPAMGVHPYCWSGTGT